jgi:hypothetical protein
LVLVLETNEPLAFALAKESVEAGIPFVAVNEIAQLVTDIDPMLCQWLWLQAARDREAEAKDSVSAANASNWPR